MSFVQCHRNRAWLRMEPAPDNIARMELRLTLWPGGEERVLAAVHPHGAWVTGVGGEGYMA